MNPMIPGFQAFNAMQGGMQPQGQQGQQNPYEQMLRQNLGGGMQQGAPRPQQPMRPGQQQGQRQRPDIFQMMQQMQQMRQQRDQLSQRYAGQPIQWGQNPMPQQMQNNTFPPPQGAQSPSQGPQWGPPVNMRK